MTKPVLLVLVILGILAGSCCKDVDTVATPTTGYSLIQADPPNLRLLASDHALLVQYGGALFDVRSGRRLDLPSKFSWPTYTREDSRTKRLIIGDGLRYLVIDGVSFQPIKIGRALVAWFDGSAIMLGVENGSSSTGDQVIWYRENAYVSTTSGAGRLIAETQSGRFLLFSRNEHRGRLAIYESNGGFSYKLFRKIGTAIGHDLGRGNALYKLLSGEFLVIAGDDPDGPELGSVLVSRPGSELVLSGVYAYSLPSAGVGAYVMFHGWDPSTSDIFRIRYRGGNRFAVEQSSTIDSVWYEGSLWTASLVATGHIAIQEAGTGKVWLRLRPE